MSQMNNSQATVVDAALTEVAIGYQNGDFVANEIFPEVPVDLRAGKIITFGKESFAVHDTTRAPGSAVKRIQVQYGAGDFAIVDKSLAALVPVELKQDAAAGPKIDLSAISVQSVVDSMLLEREVLAADLAMNPANYASTHKEALSGDDMFDNYGGTSDPLAIIDEKVEVVRSRIGRRATKVIISSGVFSVLKRHPVVLSHLASTGLKVLTVEMLTTLLNVGKVVVGNGVVSTGDGLTDIWGKSVLVTYNDTAPVSDRGRPSFGYTYNLRGFPNVMTAYYDNIHKSWVHDVNAAYKALITCNDAAFLLTNVIA